MKAAFQKEASGKIYIKEVDLPTPGPGEVLVKMEYSPINPSDLSFLQGTYSEKPTYPVIPGIEGSGTVIAVGKGILPKLRMGKRVSCTSTKGKGGSWAEYMITSAMHVIPIGKLNFEQAAVLIVNPLTALSFLDITKNNKHKAIVNNAASGALGKMIYRLAKNAGIPCINIVRNEDQVGLLKSENAKYILNSSDDSFLHDFQNLATKLSATLILDPVGGVESGYLLKNSPSGTTLMLYANLSESPINIDSRIIVQEDKQILGFSLANYNSNKRLLKALADTKKVQKLVSNKLKTTIQEIVHIDSINEALEKYKNNMTNGKILIKCKLS